MAKSSIKPKPLKEALAIYSKNCLKCSHLVDGGKKSYVACHYSKGNGECPAQEVRIVPVGQAVRYAKAVMKARNGRDMKKEAELLRRVSTKSQEFQSRFYDLLQTL